MWADFADRRPSATRLAVPSLVHVMQPTGSPSLVRQLSSDVGHAVIAHAAVREGGASSESAVRQVLLRVTKAALLGALDDAQKVTLKNRILHGEAEAVDAELVAMLGDAITCVRFSTERECAMCEETFELSDGLECTLHPTALAEAFASEEDISSFTAATGSDGATAAGVLHRSLSASQDPSVRLQEVENAILSYAEGALARGSSSSGSGSGSGGSGGSPPSPRAPAPPALGGTIHFFCSKCVAGTLTALLQPDQVELELRFTALTCCGANNTCARSWQTGQLAQVLEPPLYEKFIEARDEDIRREARLAALCDLQAKQVEAAAAAGADGDAFVADSALFNEEVLRAHLRSQGPLYQCPRCGGGPIDKIHCDDTIGHHGEQVRDPITGEVVTNPITGEPLLVNNGCMFCGAPPLPSIGDWDTWDGKFHESYLHGSGGKAAAAAAAKDPRWKCVTPGCEDEAPHLPGAPCRRCGREDPEIEAIRCRSNSRKYRELFLPIASPIAAIRRRVLARVENLPMKRAAFDAALRACVVDIETPGDGLVVGANNIVHLLEGVGVNVLSPSVFTLLAPLFGISTVTKIETIDMAVLEGGRSQPRHHDVDAAEAAARKTMEKKLSKPLVVGIFARTPMSSLADEAEFKERVHYNRQRGRGGGRFGRQRGRGGGRFGRGRGMMGGGGGFGRGGGMMGGFGAPAAAAPMWGAVPAAAAAAPLFGQPARGRGRGRGLGRGRGRGRGFGGGRVTTCPCSRG